MEFSYDAYTNMLMLLHENEYKFRLYNDYKSHEKCVILRHDVDFSIEKALRIAELDAKNNAKSTFFVLLSTDFYNVSSRKNTKLIREMISLGHDIGLHFDEQKYRDCVHDISQSVMTELHILSNVLDYQITTVSMHRPSEAFLAQNIHFDGALNVYSDRFFKKFKYVSDSRCRWHENVIDLIKGNKYSHLHILTHPFWYNKTAMQLSDICKSFLFSAVNERFTQMEENIRDFHEILERSDLN